MSIDELSRSPINHHQYRYSSVHNLLPTSLESQEYFPLAVENENNTSNHSHRMPMNLATNCTAEHINHSTLQQHSFAAEESQPSSSSSIDIENIDDNTESMSPVSIPAQNQKSMFSPLDTSAGGGQRHMELTTSTVHPAFQLSYSQLYANRAALYAPPVIFSGAIHAAHASYMGALPLHPAVTSNEPNSFSSAYLKAIQNVAATSGIYNPSLQHHHSATALINPNLTCEPASVHNPPSCMMALAPSISAGLSNSPPYCSEPRHKAEAETRKDYLGSHEVVPSGARSTSRTTYLTDKVNESTAAGAGTTSPSENYFKVPNGKEGSLKHRILVRPVNAEKSESGKTSTMRTHNSTSNFKKGTYIELSNGALRRVEDMRTEDFIQCADRSPHHQLAESTVVKIDTSPPNSVLITFSYDKNRSKVDIEVPSDHPFFVYGQGWASCNPEMSLKNFGLKCQRLQVGDICISLTKREYSPTGGNPGEGVPLRQHHVATSKGYTIARSGLNPPFPPASTPDPQYSVMHNVPLHTFSPSYNATHQTYAADMSKIMSAHPYAKAVQFNGDHLKEVAINNAMLQSLSPKMMNHFYQNQIFHFTHQGSPAKHLQNEVKSARPLQLQRPSSIHSVQSYADPSLVPAETENRFTQPQPVDASVSRKRRWSAPENIFDDDDDLESQPPRHPQQPFGSIGIARS